MSTTTMTESPAKENTPPDITIFSRMASIPIVSSSFQTIDGVLSKNALTSYPYSTAKGISTSAYKLSEPLQIRLAPLILHADGYANRAVDVVEQRYPYPFKAKPDEVVTMVRERRDSVSNYAQKTINDNVKTPAFAVAQEIDQRFTPMVDYFELAVARLNSGDAGPSTPPDAKYQYQRALALSKTLKNNIYLYSTEQLKQIHSQSVLAQRATETAQSITNLASSSYTNAQTRIHTLSDTMLAELQRLQTATATVSASLQGTVQNSASQIQSHISPQAQQTYNELSTNLSSAVGELRTIITTNDLPLQEKVGKVGLQVRENIGPLLEAVRKGISELLGGGTSEGSETPHDEKAPDEKPLNSDINGTHQYISDSESESGTD